MYCDYSLASDDYFYSLRDIIFFLENAQLPIAEYRRKAVENKITAIVEQDRNHLQKYLTGKKTHILSLSLSIGLMILIMLLSLYICVCDLVCL